MNGFRSGVRAPLFRCLAIIAGLTALAVSAPAGARTADGASANPANGHARLHAIGNRLAAANPGQCAGVSDGERCRRFTMLEDNTLNAYADGHSVVVTSRMMRAAQTDDALAFVVAHEMAHNILAHAEELKGVSSHFVDADTARRVKQTEIEADALAVELVARAGFDPAASERFLNKVMKNRRMKMPGTHPGLAQRLAVVRAAIEELKALKN